MKFRFTIIFYLLLQLQSMNSQDRNIDSDFFLLGTLVDYMGRTKSNCNKELEIVEYYSKNEISLMKFNYELLKKSYPDLLFDSLNNTLNSKILAAKIDKLFEFEFADGFCGNNEDANGKPTDSVFYGKLKYEIFKMKKEKISYLVGAYVRHGKENEKTYCISIANSSSTFPICVKLLNELATNVKTEIIEAIPFSFIIYFNPNQELKKYLNKYILLMQKLKEDYDKSFKQLKE